MDPITAEELKFYHQKVWEWRCQLHQYPETAFEEKRTQALIVETLRACGVEQIESGIATTGVVAVISGQRALPPSARVRRLGLRADMDALNLQEKSVTPYASKIPGKMHGCGHDAHVAMLLGAAHFFATHRQSFAGEIVLIFQPAEEGAGGAKAMLEQGLLERYPIDAIFAQHVWPDLPVGQVGLLSGPIMAAVDAFDIQVQGRGGHAAKPHTCRDTVVTMAELVLALQRVVARVVNPLDSAVLSITQLHTGSAFNILPEDGHLQGTVRTLQESTRTMIQAEMARICAGIALSSSAEIKLNYQIGDPVTVNEPATTQLVQEAVRNLWGQEALATAIAPSMGGEDFSYYLQKVPGTFIQLGTKSPQFERSIHNPYFDVGPKALLKGVELWRAVVAHFMA